MSFRIVEEKGNKTGSIPPHWEIYLENLNVSLITIWDSREMAELVVNCLNEYAKGKLCKKSS